MLNVISILLVIHFNAWTKEVCPIDDTHIPPVIEAEHELQILTQEENVTRKSFDVTIDGKPRNLEYAIYSASISPSKGTIIYLCGGPGMPCDAGRPKRIPADFKVVVMDYLGVGRNARHDSPDVMAIESQGLVFAELAKKLSTDVIFYAFSFGTTVATVAASKLSQEKNTKLKGVILEGVVGKGRNSYEQGFYDSAQFAWEKLSEKEKREFTESYNSLISKVSPHEKHAIDEGLVMSLMEGALVTAEVLRNFKENLDFWKQWLKKFDNSFSKGKARKLFQAAGCQIQAGSSRTAPRKVFGAQVDLVTIADATICDCPTVKEAYDPDSYQIRNLPLIYLNGGQDPSTPLSRAKAHFAGQTSTNSKIFISPPLGGHALEELAGCLDVVFESAIKSDLSTLTKYKKEIESSGCAKEANFKNQRAAH